MRLKSSCFLVIILIISITACQPVRRDLPEVRYNQNQSHLASEVLRRAEELEKAIEADTGLRDVVVIPRGQEVFVGINMDENSDFGFNAIQRIENIIMLHQRDSNVYITNENRTVEALRVIKQELSRGVEVEQYNNELNNIRDLMTI